MSSGEIKNRTVYMLSRTDGGNDTYVGCTSQPLGKRFSHHKQCAGNPSRSKYYGGSKLYQKMREVGVHRWKIIPLITFACDQNTICEMEREWIEALNANLNTHSPIENLVERMRVAKYRKKNKKTGRFYCEICGLACGSNFILKRHLDTLKHSYAWLNSVD